MAYSTLCWGVATIRQATTANGWATTEFGGSDRAGRAGERTHGDPEQDPLRNLRRLSENRPSFEYGGTLPDEKLFGPK